MKIINLNFLIFTFVFFTINVKLPAQWQSVGPYGGEVKSLYFKTDTLYAGFDDLPFGIYFSANGGNTFQKMSGDVASGKFIKKIGNTLFAASRRFNELYSTTNNGLNWNTSTFGSNSNRINGITSLGNDVFTATNEGIYKSTNSGVNWSIIYSGSFQDIVYSGTNLIITGSTLIFVSSNGGSNWFQAGTGAGAPLFASGNNVYCTRYQTPYGVYVSSNNGITWNIYNSGLPLNSGPIAYTQMGINLYAIIYPNNIYKSADGGQNWSLTGNLPGFGDAIINDDINLYANNYDFSAESGIYKSTNQGVIWYISSGLNTRDITDITVNQNSVYASISGGLLTKTDNNGSTWLSVGYTGTSVRKLFFYNTYVFASTEVSFRRSLNNGASWSTIVGDRGFDVISSGSNLWASLFSSPYFSSNGGTSWQLYSPLSNSRLGLFAISGSYLLGASRSVFDPSYYSTNNGNNWTVIIDTAFRGATAICVSGDSVYAATLTGFKKSSNNGLSWIHRITSGANLSLAKKLLLYNGRIYAATSNGIYFSYNYGFNWISFSQGLPEFFVNTMEIKADTLYVSVKNAGIWKRAISTITGSESNSNTIPSQFKLFQNYPNPFNPMTKIKFDIPSSMHTNLKIYDILGREITTLVNGNLKPGSYEIDFDGSGLPGGVYFCKIESSGFTKTKKMVLVK